LITCARWGWWGQRGGHGIGGNVEGRGWILIPRNRKGDWETIHKITAKRKRASHQKKRSLPEGMKGAEVYWCHRVRSKPASPARNRDQSRSECPLKDLANLTRWFNKKKPSGKEETSPSRRRLIVDDHYSKVTKVSAGGSRTEKKKDGARGSQRSLWFRVAKPGSN